MSKDQDVRTKVLIIGSGPAGYTAAIYAARANLKPVQVLGLQPGGQLTITTDVENYPGFADMIQGPWLMEQMKAQAEHVGTEMIYDYIKDVDFSKRPFVTKADRRQWTVYTADTVIICTGAKARWLGPPEAKRPSVAKAYQPARPATDFSIAARNVAVVGGGNSSSRGSNVPDQFLHQSHLDPPPRFIACRKDRPGPPVQQSERSKSSGTMRCRRYSWQLLIAGVTGVSLKNVKTGDNLKLDVTDYSSPSATIPLPKIFKGKVKMDDQRIHHHRTRFYRDQISLVFSPLVT
jgi:thioredoxin reductase (NADPH)